MNIDAHGPIGLWLAEHEMIDPMRARIEIMMNKGLQIIVPDFIMPQFNPEPFTEDELREIYGHKRNPNISKLRSINRKAKQK
jgi:hypothetical protein